VLANAEASSCAFKVLVVAGMETVCFILRWARAQMLPAVALLGGHFLSSDSCVRDLDRLCA
jgi:hypothetical protein